jgi:hypothetical protein
MKILIILMLRNKTARKALRKRTVKRMRKWLKNIREKRAKRRMKVKLLVQAVPVHVNTMYI